MPGVSVLRKENLRGAQPLLLCDYELLCESWKPALTRHQILVLGFPASPNCEK